MFAVIVKTPVEHCMRYATLQQADRLAWQLQQLPEVQATVSLADSVKQVTAGTLRRLAPSGTRCRATRKS